MAVAEACEPSAACDSSEEGRRRPRPAPPAPLLAFPQLLMEVWSQVSLVLGPREGPPAGSTVGGRSQCPAGVGAGRAWEPGGRGSRAAPGRSPRGRGSRLRAKGWWP